MPPASVVPPAGSSLPDAHDDFLDRCHIDEAAEVTLERHGDRRGGAVAVLGHDEVRLTGAWLLALVRILPMKQYHDVRVLLNAARFT